MNHQGAGTKRATPRSIGAALCFIVAVVAPACGGYEAVEGDLDFGRTSLSLAVDVRDSDDAPKSREGGPVAYRVTGEREKGQRSPCETTKLDQCVRPGPDGALAIDDLCNGEWNLRVTLVDENQRRCEDNAPSVGDCHDGDSDEYRVSLFAGANARKVRCALRASSTTFDISIH